MLEPADEGVGPGDESQPGAVGFVVGEREPLRTAGFESGDVVFDTGVGAHVAVGFRGVGCVVGPVPPVAVVV